MEIENNDKEKIITNMITESTNGKYGLAWDREKEPEKIVEQCDKYIPILQPVEEKDIKLGNIDNILIEGDNFHALTDLCYTHKESVDVIYIDPPYNTGNKDFVYNDKFVDEEDGYRHSKWLNFMEKRLLLARTLLKKDGIICISIDDNEYAQLKLLCDSIFFERNRLSTQHIQVRYADKTLNEKNDWQPVMEYVLIYARNANEFKANKPKEDYSIGKFVYEFQELTPGTEFTVKGRKITVFKKGEWQLVKHDAPREDLLKETWVSGSIYSGTGNGTMVQNVIEPRVETDGYGSLYKIEGLGEDGLGYRYFTGPQKKGATRSKMYSGIPVVKLEELNSGEAVKYKSIPNIFDYSPDFGNIRLEGGIAFNSGKKPVKMLKDLINYHPNKNAVVLDFFAGSGSTGHAVLELNKEDGGSRKFILCTNNESNICEEITYPRLKNVMEGYSSKKALGENLRYLKTEFIRNTNNRDQLKFDLTEKCIPMLCVKESTFNLVSETEEYKIYTNNDKTKYTCVYYEMFGDLYEEFLEKIKQIEEQKTLYIFSLGDTTEQEGLEDVKNYKIESIPHRIIEFYKRTIKLCKEN